MLPSFTFIAKEMVTVGIYKGSQLKNPDLRGDCPNSTLWHFLGLNIFIGAPLKGLFTIFLFSVRSNISNRNGVWYS